MTVNRRQAKHGDFKIKCRNFREMLIYLDFSLALPTGVEPVFQP